MAEVDEFYQEVGRKILRARKGRMTQEDLGERVSLTRTSITNIEKGRQKILLHTLVDIAGALGIAPATLLPDTAIDQKEELKKALRGRSKQEREFIKSALSSVGKEAKS